MHCTVYMIAKVVPIELRRDVKNIFSIKQYWIVLSFHSHHCSTTKLLYTGVIMDKVYIDGSCEFMHIGRSIDKLLAENCCMLRNFFGPFVRQTLK